MGAKTIEILLVEDSPSDARLIREALRESPAPVHISVALDGVEAMEYLRSCERGTNAWPELMILDLNLPRKNGREVLAEVKTDPVLRKIPIIVMTSSKADDDITQAYALNANCYIAKPGDMAGYVSVVRAIEEFWFSTALLPEAFPPLGAPVLASRHAGA